MKDDTIRSFKNFTRQFCLQTAILTTFSTTGLIFLIFYGNLVRAQSHQPDLQQNTPTDREFAPDDSSNRLKPIRQRNFYFNSNGSQQFFRQDNNNFYLLPEEESDSILQIDENVKTEEIEEENLPSKSLDE